MYTNPTFESTIGFGAEAAPEAVGMDAAGVTRIAGLFDDQIAAGLHPGAQLVVLRHGQVVLDRAAGLADVRRRVPVTPDTPFNVFSCTKAFTGACVHRLIEEGRVELDAPISRYWPEFGCRGKETATVRHAFLHQAGVPVRGLYRQILLWPNWEAVTRNVAGLPAEFPPGSRTAYHLVNYGFILGEIVRRVTGMPIEQYMAQSFLEPLGLRNTWLGLPDSEWDRRAVLYWGHSEQRLPAILFNRRAVRGAVMPAATLNSTARDLAVFYQMLLNGGQYEGRRYLRPETIEAARTLGYEGHDGTIGVAMRWAYGFHLGGPIYGNAGPEGMGARSTTRTFGHFGQASCMAWADPDADLVVAFTCNRMLHTMDSNARWAAISDAIWQALKVQTGPALKGTAGFRQDYQDG